MMKRLILCVLCLVMAVSACLAEGIPEKSNRYKASMFKEIPEKTVKKEFTQYMAPGYKIEYDTGRAWCPDLIMSGEGCYETYYEITDNERVRICREIAEKLLDYDGFTDIVFNPQKSINCQARSCAIYVGMKRKG